MRRRRSARRRAARRRGHALRRAGGAEARRARSTATTSTSASTSTSTAGTTASCWASSKSGRAPGPRKSVWTVDEQRLDSETRGPARPRPRAVESHQPQSPQRARRQRRLRRRVAQQRRTAARQGRLPAGRIHRPHAVDHAPSMPTSALPLATRPTRIPERPACRSTCATTSALVNRDIVLWLTIGHHHVTAGRRLAGAFARDAVVRAETGRTSSTAIPRSTCAGRRSRRGADAGEFRPMDRRPEGARSCRIPEQAQAAPLPGSKVWAVAGRASSGRAGALRARNHRQDRRRRRKAAKESAQGELMRRRRERGP